MSIEHTKKPPSKPKNKPITPAWLEAAAVYYLSRFESSEANLTKVLTRKAERRSGSKEEAKAAQGLIKETVLKMQKLGYVDDLRFTKNQIRNLFARGCSRKTIIGKLRLKGVKPSLIESVLEENSEDENPQNDEAAVINFARKKRLGPFRKDEPTPEKIKKELAALGRAGFDYELARRIIAAENVEDIER